MDIESLKEVIDAYEYSTNWERILKEYYIYYEKEIERCLPRGFAEHFDKNKHYHDWLLNDIAIHNCNHDTTKPLLDIKLSKDDALVSLRFEGVTALHIDGDFSNGYVGHMDELEMCAFLKQGKLFTFHCVFLYGLKVLVSYKELVWSIIEKESVQYE